MNIDLSAYIVAISFYSSPILMEKSSTSPLVRCLDEVPGYEERKNDVVFCGSDAQQHVVFFPGDVQVRSADFVVGSVRLKTPKNT